jgi:hypothetical protein
MTCRDLRELGDSFLSDELLAETNHELLRHLETCPSCRHDIDARRRLRAGLRGSFERAADLQPRPEFVNQLRARLRDATLSEDRRSTIPLRWMARAAGIVLAVGLAVAAYVDRTLAPTDALARDAIGDHRNCALNYRLLKEPVPLEDAAQRFDSAYRLLIDAPEDDVQTPEGPVRVVERHSCVYRERRFGHVIMQYRGRVVSLLMTADTADAAEAVPHVIGPRTSRLSVVSVTGSGHAVLLVSDLGRSELTQLSRIVSLPLIQRLQGKLFASDRGLLAALPVPGGPGLIHSR